MPKVSVFNQEGKSAGDITLNDKVFGIEPNQNVLFDAIVMQQASKRQGTHAVKNRSDVRGGGRKPWRQKGTYEGWILEQAGVEIPKSGGKVVSITDRIRVAG